MHAMTACQQRVYCSEAAAPAITPWIAKFSEPLLPTHCARHDKERRLPAALRETLSSTAGASCWSANIGGKGASHRELSRSSSLSTPNATTCEAKPHVGSMGRCLVGKLAAAERHCQHDVAAVCSMKYGTLSPPVKLRALRVAIWFCPPSASWLRVSLCILQLA